MDKEKVAIMRLQEASKMSLTIYQKPLIVTTSGGKDSSVCLELAQRSGIPFEVMHNHTTADAPETVYFVRNDLRRFEGKGITCILNYPVPHDHGRPDTTPASTLKSATNQGLRSP